MKLLQMFLYFFHPSGPVQQKDTAAANIKARGLEGSSKAAGPKLNSDIRLVLKIK